MDIFEYLVFAKESQASFAKRVGVSQMAISYYARKKRRPSPEIAQRIQDATGGLVDAHKLVFREITDDHPYHRPYYRRYLRGQV